MYRNNLLKVVCLICIAAGSVSALCVATMKTYSVVAETTINGRDALVINDYGPGDPFLISSDPLPFTPDTLYNADLLAQLSDAYEANDVVVIATTTNVTEFVPAFTEGVTEVFASESVTVHIESVLKGTIRQEWQFIHTLDDPTYIQKIDPETGEIITGTMFLSHGTPGYRSILNKRFLLFMKADAISVGAEAEFGMPLLRACSMFTNAYRINSRDELFFDGEKRDADNAIVAIPELKISLSEVTNAIKQQAAISTPTPHRFQGPAFAGSMPGVTYDLFGRILRNKVTRSQEQRASGVVIRVYRMADGTLLRRKAAAY